MNMVIKCPSCDGSGKMKITSEEYQKPETKEVTEITCIICAGYGVIDEEMQAILDYEKTMWCECEISSGAHYVQDSKDEMIGKHHWKCNDCGKVVQIG